MKYKHLLILGMIGFVSGIAGALGTIWLQKVENPAAITEENLSNKSFFKRVSMQNFADNSFIDASKISTPTVVFIKTVSQATINANPFSWFFDPYSSRSQAITSTGSGVIISKDGYIVTNNHVIAGAEKISVILSEQKKEYVARLIGADPSTDLALLKIERSDLPFVAFANSDAVQIGEWVLAVGNPFNLTSTVTAGIVSAKGRNINIVDNQFPIESFIQTDAAINPGNSGGALVNLKGQLIGINTAIASNTGSYNGYGFAIPSNIVNKIIKDFIEYGKVSRAFLGIETEDINDKRQKEFSITLENGAFIASLQEDGPAEKAGLKIGDIITAIDAKKVDAKSTYDEALAYYRPNDKVEVEINRNGSVKKFSIVLISAEKVKQLQFKNAIRSDQLGATFSPLSALEKQKYGQGIKVTGIERGLIANYGITEGFIITKFNGKVYDDPNLFIAAFNARNGKVEIEGFGADGGKRFLSYFGY